MDEREQDSKVCGELRELMARWPEVAFLIEPWVTKLESDDLHRYEAVMGCLNSLAEAGHRLMRREPLSVLPLEAPRRQLQGTDIQPVIDQYRAENSGIPASEVGFARPKKRKVPGIVVTAVPLGEPPHGFESLPEWELHRYLVNRALADWKPFDPAEKDVHDVPLLVWADGSGTVSDSDAGVGVVFEDRGVRVGIGAYIGKGTNNVAELSAVLYAVRAIRGQHRFRPVIVHTDSQYTIGALTKQWEMKANVELIATVREELRHFRNLTFQHVRGHVGILGNEQADKLAGTATRTKGLVRL